MKWNEHKYTNIILQIVHKYYSSIDVFYLCAILHVQALVLICIFSKMYKNNNIKDRQVKINAYGIYPTKGVD